VLLSLVHNVNAPLPAQYKIARKKNVEKKRERERENPTFGIPTKMQEIFRPIICCKKLQTLSNPIFRASLKFKLQQEIIEKEIFRPNICCKKLQILSNPIFRASLKFKLQQEIIEKEMVWHQLHKILLSLPYP
jgi:hypothetical protein